MQIVLFYLPPISVQFTLEMFITVRNPEKFTKAPYFGGSGSFKDIDVDIPKSSTSACYDKQHACAYLQPFSQQTSQQQ